MTHASRLDLRVGSRHASEVEPLLAARSRAVRALMRPKANSTSLAAVGVRADGSSLLPVTTADLVPRPPVEPLFCHTPKCGSSFEASIHIHGGRAHGMHDPIANNATESEVGRFAMLFRHPEERMMSMYWWIRQSYTRCCFPTHFGWPSVAEWQRVANNIYQKGWPPNRILGPYVGCQAGMLLGHRCCSRHRYNSSMSDVINAAKARVDRLFFVGLTQEWLLSVCLFNYKMTGVRYVTALQLRNCRPGSVERFNRMYNKSLERGVRFVLANLTDHSMVKRDELDHAVYEHAVERFFRELHAYNISAASCPSASDAYRGSSCGGTMQRLDAATVRALNFTRLFPNVTRRFVASTERAHRSP